MLNKMKTWLKADLHLHANEDPEYNSLNYSAKQLIDEASRLKFDVLSFTFHNKVLDGKKFKEIIGYSKENCFHSLAALCKLIGQ